MTREDVLSAKQALCEKERSGDLQVDEEARVIRGVKVLGQKSRNGYVYGDQAIKDSATLCDDLSVSLNGHNPDTRGWRDQNGALREGRVEEGRSVYDWHLEESHGDTPRLLEKATKFPRSICLSHEVEPGDYTAELNEEDNQVVITGLKRVSAVALVPFGGTNDGLFEHDAGEDDMSQQVTPQKPSNVGELKTQFPELVNAAVEEATRPIRDETEKLLKENEALKSKLSELEESVAKFEAEKQAAEREKLIDTIAEELKCTKAVEERRDLLKTVCTDEESLRGMMESFQKDPEPKKDDGLKEGRQPRSTASHTTGDDDMKSETIVDRFDRRLAYASKHDGS